MVNLVFAPKGKTDLPARQVKETASVGNIKAETGYNFAGNFADDIYAQSFRCCVTGCATYTDAVNVRAFIGSRPFA